MSTSSPSSALPRRMTRRSWCWSFWTVSKNAYGADDPSGEYISGGNMAAPVAADLLVNILDYMNYGRQYTADEISTADAMVPLPRPVQSEKRQAVAKGKGIYGPGGRQ